MDPVMCYYCSLLQLDTMLTSCDVWVSTKIVFSAAGLYCKSGQGSGGLYS